MRKLLLVVGMSIFGCSAILAQGNEQLPDNVNGFISDNYSNERIEKVKVDKDRNNRAKGYDVKLSNNISMEFDGNGEVVEIEGKTRIPDNVLPNHIVAYVNKNYNGNFIKEYEKEDDEVEIELDNGVEIEFDLQGNLVEVDD